MLRGGVVAGSFCYARSMEIPTHYPVRHFRHCVAPAVLLLKIIIESCPVRNACLTAALMRVGRGEFSC